MPKTWPRDIWLDAMWDDPSLKPVPRVVAQVFARYAGKKEITWCSWPELMLRTGVRSRDTISSALATLVNGGWLECVEPARQRRSARYRMTVPSSPDSGPLDGAS